MLLPSAYADLGSAAVALAGGLLTSRLGRLLTRQLLRA
jgi:hypothetical protein